MTFISLSLIKTFKLQLIMDRQMSLKLRKTKFLETIGTRQVTFLSNHQRQTTWQTIITTHLGLKILTMWPKINIPTSFSQIVTPLVIPKSQISFIPSLLRQMKFRHLLSCSTTAVLFMPTLNISIVSWKVFSLMGSSVRITIVDCWIKLRR